MNLPQSRNGRPAPSRTPGFELKVESFGSTTGNQEIRAGNFFYSCVIIGRLARYEG
jgi:hypothetical protein